MHPRLERGLRRRPRARCPMRLNRGAGAWVHQKNVSDIRVEQRSGRFLLRQAAIWSEAALRGEKERAGVQFIDSFFTRSKINNLLLPWKERRQEAAFGSGQKPPFLHLAQCVEDLFRKHHSYHSIKEGGFKFRKFAASAYSSLKSLKWKCRLRVLLWKCNFRPSSNIMHLKMYNHTTPPFFLAEEFFFLDVRFAFSLWLDSFLYIEQQMFFRFLSDARAA